MPERQAAQKIACRITHKDAPPDTDIIVARFYGDAPRAPSLRLIERFGRIISFVYAQPGEPFQKGRYRVEIGIGQARHATAFFLVE